MFVVLLCVVFSLFACDSNVNMELSNEAKKIVSTDEVKLVGEDGKATFRIVRPDSTDSSAGPVAVEIFKKYKELLNAIPKQVTDAEKSDGVREILVGDTNREVTKKEKELLPNDGTGKDSDYFICSIGDDIVIL